MTQPYATTGPLPHVARPSEAVVYWTLLGLCEGAGGLFQVSLRRLAWHCGLSVGTTNRAVLALSKQGLIRYRPGVNQVRPSTFEVPSGRGRVMSPSSATELSRSATAVAKIGVPLPTDNDLSLCRDIYRDDDDRGAVHRQNGDGDRSRKLARTVAEVLDDTRNLALYESYCSRYPAWVIMRALQEARKPAPDKIRVSRGALFNHLCQRYGGKDKHNQHPGHQAR